MSTARRCDSVILCTQGCMLKHSLGAFSSGKMTLGPNERDTSSITYCGRSLASSAPFRGGVVDLLNCNFFSFSSFLSLLCINYFNINMHKIFCTKNAKKENLQHPVMDAVFLCRNPQKNTEKIKIRYIG